MGSSKSIFSQIQNSPKHPRGGEGGQENYGLFPQFGTFLFLTAPLGKSQVYLIPISCTYKSNLRQTLGISRVYIRHISYISKEHFMEMSWKSQRYLVEILSKSLANLRPISGQSQKISCKSLANLRKISLKSQPFPRYIFDISQAYHRKLSGKSQANLMKIIGKFYIYLTHMIGISQVNIKQI